MKRWEIIYAPHGPVALREYDGRGRLAREIPTVVALPEVCHHLKRSRRQVYRYIKTGTLQPLGKFLGEWLFDGRPLENLARGFNDVKRQRGFRLPSGLKSLFQEYNAGSLHLILDADLIIARLLDRGTQKELQWLFRHYPSEQVRSVLSQQGSRLLSDRALRFWSWWFKIPPTSSWRRSGRRWGGAS